MAAAAGVYGAGRAPAYSSSQEEAPKKYVVKDGVRQISDEWKAWKAGQGQPVTTAANPKEALPTVSSMDEYEQLRLAAQKEGSEVPTLAPATDAAIEMIQEPEAYRKIGLAPDATVDAIGTWFAVHEVPLGLLNKLLGLSEFNCLEFMIDDSGSMGGPSGKRSKSGQPQTRWEEARDRLKVMLEVLAYVPTKEIKICFLNRKDTITLRREGETPEIFIENAHRQIEAAFRSPPSGTTPVLERLTESFRRGEGKKVARYLFNDGVPDGGKEAEKRIAKMLQERKDRSENPFTFLLCSDREEDVAWTERVEEVVPYCSGLDDFVSERAEVRKDQGDVFPYTEGVWLISQLVSALNPDDLDALDESIPVTKWAFDNLTGVVSSEEEYERYFKGFEAAQVARRVEHPSDDIKKRQNWRRYYNDFRTQHTIQDIAEVKAFRERLKKVSEAA